MIEPNTPILDSIDAPVDLRRLDRDGIELLAAEMRALIVATVQRNGGHLGSNLGIVELTIALHRVFQSPKDALLFDTGHQTYPHKLLTGRRYNFASLREPGGLSGYPNHLESEHDWIENSHASTALSYAHGLASAFRANKEDRRVIAVIGDGSLTGGMAFEGLNNLGHSNSNVIIVLNDNGRSYAPTVSMLSESLMKIRSNPVYMRRQQRMEAIAKSVPWVGDMVYRGIDATKAAIRHMWEPPAFFEQLGIRYIGPFNGHDADELEQVFENVKYFEGPTVVHVITQKGRDMRLPRTTRSRTCMTRRRSRRAAIRLLLPIVWSSWARRTLKSSRLRRRCPTPPGCSRSWPVSPTALSTSALPSSTP